MLIVIISLNLHYYFLYSTDACKKLTTSTEATKSSTDDTAPHLLNVVIEPLKFSQDPDGGNFNVKLAFSVIGSLLGLAAIIFFLLLLKINKKFCKRSECSIVLYSLFNSKVTELIFVYC